ncbi:MAG: chorismate mutase [Anaerolineales bacterium]|jgi:chorismate mutase
MPIRGIRGATTVMSDDPDLILEATRELLEAILYENDGIQLDEIASAFFTATEDIASAYPALAARQMGWDHVPMMCAREIPVPGSLSKCIRVLIHWNTDREQNEIHHVYLRNAVQLRPDLVSNRWSSTAKRSIETNCSK